MKPFWVYMLRCSDGAYYVGHTDELERRIAQHQHGEFPGYTRGRTPVVLVFAHETATRDDAFVLERRLKGWSRAKKEALIRGDWGELNVLARGPDRSERSVRPSTPGRDAVRAERTPRPYAQDERNRS